MYFTKIHVSNVRKAKKKLRNILKKLMQYVLKEKRDIDEENINLEELKKMIKQDNVILLDVRSPQEYKEKHIRGAILIPSYEINKQEIQKRLKDKEQTIIVYCLSGARSQKIIELLKKIGYTNLYHLKDGIEAYPEDDIFITNEY